VGAASAATGAALGLALLAAACAGRIEEPRPIPVPAGLSLAQVDEAIRVAVKSSQDGRGWKRSWWEIESGVPGRIVARLAVEGHVLRIGIEYTATAVTARIVDTHALDQDGDKIHPRALTWQTNLETRIAEEMQWSARHP
jgi:hypothetical protein